MDYSLLQAGIQTQNNTRVVFQSTDENAGTKFSASHAVVTLILILVSSSILLNPSPIAGIPHRRSAVWTPGGDLPILGLHNFPTGRVLDWLGIQCIKLNSPIVQLFLPIYSTTRPVVVIADIRKIEDITLRRNATIDRASLLQVFFGLLFPRASIGMPTHKLFKGRRKLWNQVLAPRFMRDVVEPCLHTSVKELIELWRKKAELAQGLPLAAGEDMRQTALDAMWTILAGSELGLLGSQMSQLHDRGEGAVFQEKTRAIFAKTEHPPVYRALSVLIMYWVWLVQGGYPRFYAWLFPRIPHFKATHRIAEDAVADALRRARLRVVGQQVGNLDRRTCRLEEVLRRAGIDRELEDHATDEALKDELLELLVSGHETTAVATSWGLKYLADNQSVQFRLFQSVFGVFPDCNGTRLPSAPEILNANIPYLDAFIAELLRLSCTIPVSFRETVQDCNILGYEVPAKTTLILLTGGPSYLREKPFHILEKDRLPSSRAAALRSPARDWNPAYDISTFLPERWLTEDGKFDPKAGPTLPFSAGIRACFGKKIAPMELKLLFVMLVLSFRLEQMEKRWSGYGRFDGLTSKPTCCYVKPKWRA